MRRSMAKQQIRESRGPAYGSGRRGSKHPAIRRQRFPGELALTDLHPGGDADRATQALARYAALRYASLALEGASDLEEERSAAAEYVFAALTLREDEAAALRGLLELDAGSTPVAAGRALQRAGTAAAQDAAGAAAGCWRQAYRIASDAGEWALGLQAAESLARMAERDGAAAAFDIWAYRARRMRMRLEM